MLVVVDVVIVTMSVAAGDSNLSLWGVCWITWAVNANEILGMEHGYPMYDLFRAHIGVEEELSLFIFTVGIMIGKLSYLLIFLPDNKNNRYDKYDKQHLLK